MRRLKAEKELKQMEWECFSIILSSQLKMYPERKYKLWIYVCLEAINNVGRWKNIKVNSSNKYETH